LYKCNFHVGAWRLEANFVIQLVKKSEDIEVKHNAKQPFTINNKDYGAVYRTTYNQDLELKICMVLLTSFNSIMLNSSPNEKITLVSMLAKFN